MPRVDYSDLAEDDLLQLGRYIARHDLAAAHRLFDRIQNKAELYSRNPELGESWPAFGKGARAFRVGRYLVFYRAIEGGIELARVFHTSRDLPKHFQGD